MASEELSETSTRTTRAIGQVTGWLGSYPAILGSVAVIVLWAATGPLLGFSDTWQLIINTATTVVTFNMVFIIQNTQNRDGRAIQAKLDAQARALARLMEAMDLDGSDDLGRLVGVEDAPEAVIKHEQERVRRAGAAGAGSSTVDITRPLSPLAHRGGRLAGPGGQPPPRPPAH